MAPERLPALRSAIGLVAVGVSLVLSACSGDEGAGGGSTTTTAEAQRAPRTIDSLAAGEPGEEPGCAVGVSDGTQVATTAYGLADLDAGVPNDDATLFDLGSVSKQFTAGVILGLVEEDVLTLDDTVGSWLPEVRGPAGDVVVRQLLHHRSGIPEYGSLLIGEDGFRLEDEATQADAIESIAAAPLEFEPGTRFTYSNTNYVLLAEIAHRAAERPFTELVEQRLFEPAGMTTAFVSDYHSSSPVVATSYSPAPDFQPLRWRWTLLGDGAIHASVTDLLTWGQFLLADLDPFIDGAESASNGNLYGAGLFVEEVDGQTVVGHTGTWQGFHSYFAVVPDEGLTVAAMCNRSDEDPTSVAASALELWRSSD